MAICKECGLEIEKVIKGMCRRCWTNEYNRKNKDIKKQKYLEKHPKKEKSICIKCKNNLEYCKSLCKKCYSTNYKITHKDVIDRYYNDNKNTLSKIRKEYYSRPDIKIKSAIYNLEYNKKPEILLRRKNYKKEYYERPSVKRKKILWDAKRQAKIIQNRKPKKEKIMCKKCHNNISYCQNLCKKCYNKRQSLFYSKKNKQTYLLNKDEILLKHSLFYKNNKERIALYNKKWISTPRGKFISNTYNRLRHYKLKNVKHCFSDEEWFNKIKQTQGICPMCFEYFIPKNSLKMLTMDHEPALSNVEIGHKYYIDDVTPICKSCNSSKRKKSGKKINFEGFLEYLRSHPPNLFQ